MQVIRRPLYQQIKATLERYVRLTQVVGEPAIREPANAPLEGELLSLLGQMLNGER